VSRPPVDDRPRAPWHPVPLAELCVLVGIVLLAVGLLRGTADDRGRLLIASGLSLGSLGGLDTAAREHFAGFASHTMVLAGVPAVSIAAVLFFARAPWIAIPIAAVAVFAVCAVLLNRAWRRVTL
jgi:hypothetical protein